MWHCSSSFEPGAKSCSWAQSCRSCHGCWVCSGYRALHIRCGVPKHRSGARLIRGVTKNQSRSGIAQDSPEIISFRNRSETMPCGNHSGTFVLVSQECIVSKCLRWCTDDKCVRHETLCAPFRRLHLHSRVKCKVDAAFAESTPYSASPVVCLGVPRMYSCWARSLSN